MKTKLIKEQASQGVRRHVILFFVLIASFAWMGGCLEKEEMKEIPADSVTTGIQSAPSVPVWVPASTNPSIRFYFIPEMSIYYDAFLGNFVYHNGMYWVYSPILPAGYAYFDLFDSNIVFLSIGISHPWHRHHFYVSHYPIYFFGGKHYHNHGHGWRFYNENGRKFFGPHKNMKYKEQFDRHRNNFNSKEQRHEKERFDIPKHENKSGIQKQEKEHGKFENNGRDKKQLPGYRQQYDGKQKVKDSRQQKNHQESKGGGKKGGR